MTPTSSRQAAGEWLRSRGRSAGPRDRGWLQGSVSSGSRPGRTLVSDLVQDLASPLTPFCFMNHSISSEMEMIAEKTACLGAFIGLSSYKYEL